MMRIVSVIVFALLCLACPARGAVTLSGPTGGAIAVSPGGSFTVMVWVSSGGEPITGASMWMTPSAGDVFSLDGRFLGESPFQASYAADSPGVISGRTAELGGDILNVAAPLGAGSYPLGAFQFSVAEGTLAGTYTLALGGDGYYQDAGNQLFAYDGVGAVIVNVTPEPALSTMLGLLGGGVLLARRRRNGRA